MRKYRLTLIAASVTILVCLPSLSTNTARAGLGDLVKVTGAIDNSETTDFQVADIDGVADIYGVRGARGSTCKQRRQLYYQFLQDYPGLIPIITNTADILEWTPSKDEDLANFTNCPEGVDGDFRIWYTTCSMTMFVGPEGAPFQVLRWTVPPEAPEAEMIVVSPGKKGVYVKLETALEQLKGGQELEIQVDDPEEFTNLQTNITTQNLTGDMAEEARPVTKLQETKTYSVAGMDGNVPVVREYEAQRVEYNHVGRMNPLFTASVGPLAAVGLDLIKVENQGWAYVAPDVEGLDVIRMFYNNFARHVAGAAGAGSLFGGMVEQMSTLIAYGLPLEGQNTSTTSMSAGGGSVYGLAGFAQGMTSSSNYRIRAVDTAPTIGTALCAPIVMPDGFEITDLTEVLAGASDQASAAGSEMGQEGPSAASQGMPMPPGAPTAAGQGDAGATMANAMTQMNAAMASMTPEQQQALQQVGLVMGQAMAGANPAAAGSSGAGAPPGPAPAAKASASSAALATGDLTQTAQNYLNALGYEPGNTEGVMDTLTTVAISQFQAEKGLEVTGKVTPQLVGILAAEVDK